MYEVEGWKHLLETNLISLDRSHFQFFMGYSIDNTRYSKHRQVLEYKAIWC